MNVKEYAKRLAAHRGSEWLCGFFPHEAKELIKLCGESADDNTLDLLQAMLNDQAKLQAERDRLTAKLADYDNQWSRIASTMGGDATNAKDGTIAGFVIERFNLIVAENQRLRDALGEIMRFVVEDKYLLGTKAADELFDKARQALKGRS